uniref:NADH-ubiquinone oxidoreductase chain 4L n=1 Tax=Eulimnogammarus verrucosus TaxID=36941 RepID=V5QDF6_EULVE|nr:NADH dehydrogenase subunit 4L [Eulimnogammarus verrucosus]AHB14323.1 NADH dehydrogenase subunit 4L [Eulimnogammarus verrucosus]
MFYIEGMVSLGLLVGGLSFILNYGHLLSSLLSLEFMSLMIYLWLSVSGLWSGNEFLFSLFYLVMVACESVLGLSLLISSVYSHGVDYMKSYNSLSC